MTPRTASTRQTGTGTPQLALEGTRLGERNLGEIRSREQVRQQDHASGQRVEELVRALGEQHDDEEHLDDQVRDDQRDDGRALLVHTGERLHETALGRRLVGALGGEHGVAEHGADHGTAPRRR